MRSGVVYHIFSKVFTSSGRENHKMSFRLKQYTLELRTMYNIGQSSDEPTVLIGVCALNAHFLRNFIVSAVKCKSCL